jgi:UDP-N-acetylmuramoyl-tripeptide--D-alanyl-D-alanine ligase
VLRKTRFAAVVGSFGKSTTTRALCAALGLPGPSRDNWNAGAELASTVLRIPPGSRHAVIEVGIDGQGQMERCARLLRPDIAVVTSIGSEHLTSLGTLDVTRAEKAKMVEALPASGLAVLNGDDRNVLWMRDRTAAHVRTYGFDDANQVRASDVAAGDMGGVHFKLHIGNQAFDVKTRLFGRHMVYPILAAVAVSQAEGREIRSALAALERLGPTSNRLESIRHPSGATLLLDTFKGSLETIEVALDTLDQLSAKRKILVLGEVEELTGKLGDTYRALGKRAGEIAARVVFVGGKRSYDCFKVGASAGGLSRNVLTHVRRNPLDAAEVVGTDLRPGDLVLVKGRRTQRLERVALALMGEKVECQTRLCRRSRDCPGCPLLRGGI